MYWNSFTLGKGGLIPGQEFDNKSKYSMLLVGFEPAHPGKNAT